MGPHKQDAAANGNLDSASFAVCLTLVLLFDVCCFAVLTLAAASIQASADSCGCGTAGTEW